MLKDNIFYWIEFWLKLNLVKDYGSDHIVNQACAVTQNTATQKTKQKFHSLFQNKYG